MIKLSNSIFLGRNSISKCRVFYNNSSLPVYPHQAPLPTPTTLPLDLGEPPPDGPGGLGGHPVDPPVEEDHHHHRGEE